MLAYERVDERRFIYGPISNTRINLPNTEENRDVTCYVHMVTILRTVSECPHNYSYMLAAR